MIERIVIKQQNLPHLGLTNFISENFFLQDVKMELIRLDMNTALHDWVFGKFTKEQLLELHTIIGRWKESLD